jgi:hypothetical protein
MGKIRSTTSLSLKETGTSYPSVCIWFKNYIIYIFTSKLDILSLISLSDMVCINLVTLILEIIGWCDVTNKTTMQSVVSLILGQGEAYLIQPYLI